MGRIPTRMGWQHGLLALLVVFSASGPVLQDAARASADGRAARLSVDRPAVNAVPPAVPLAQLAPPAPSGAPPTVPRNPMMDGEVQSVGTPPTNHDFSQDGYEVGSPPGNNAGTLNTATGPHELTTAPFVVEADAQIVTVHVRSLDPTFDAQFYLGVVAGGTVTTINGTDYSAPPAGELKRFTIAAWQGQTIQLRVRRQYRSLTVTDLGVQRVDVPGWDVQDRVRLVEGGPSGAGRAARLDVVEGSASLTSAPFALPADAQQVAVAVNGSAYGRVALELLTGADFATTVLLREWTRPPLGLGRRPRPW